MHSGNEIFHLMDFALNDITTETDSFFGICKTEKGMQHYMSLNNCWLQLADSYSEKSYMPIVKPGFIEKMEFSLDTEGNSIESKVTWYNSKR